MASPPHMAVVSDVAANHVETLYRAGSRTLPALTDLLEICQAAVLYDDLAVSPSARRRSSLFQQFDFISTPEFHVTDAASDEAPPPAADSDGAAIVIDADDERGPFSTSVEGEIVLAMAFAETFYDDPVVGLLVDVDRLPPDADPGLRFFAKLPALMLGLQHQRGLIAYENDAARASLDGVIAPMIGRYTQYSRHLLRLQQSWRVGLVSSVLEQPIVSSLLVERALADPDPEAGLERDRAAARLNAALLRAPARAKFFEKWRFPPIGMMVLAQAKSLDDVPAVVRQMRGRFERLRQGLSSIEARLAALARDAAGFSTHAEQAAREREALQQRLREAYAAFDDEINRRRQWGRRTEIVFNALDFTLSVAEGFGVGTVGKLIELIGLKRMVLMHRVPGLLGLASSVRGADAALVTEVAGRLLGNADSLQLQADLLRTAYDHAESYVTHRGVVPPVLPGLAITPENEKPLKLTDREMWMELVRNAALREVLMPAAAGVRTH